NENLRMQVNANGTVTVLCKATGKVYENLNYLSDQGEVGNGWRHFAPRFDRVYNSLGATANVCVTESGPLSSAIRVDYTFAVPIDYADGLSRNEELVDLPVQVEYRLEKGATTVKVVLTVDNLAKDHWLRVNFPTGLTTDETWADSHFDVVTRPIPLPDSTGWVEPAGGVHPLRTFVDMTDGTDGLAVMPKGVFEYEAFEDDKRTLALTLVRSCRIKLAVSEEKMTELPDPGVQCPGLQKFEYAIALHQGDWKQAGLLAEAAKLYTPVRAAMTGRGKGNLPFEASLFAIDTANIHITCVKQAEDGSGLIIRLFNGDTAAQNASLIFGSQIRNAHACTLNEDTLGELPVNGNTMAITVAPKKIQTYRIVLA
ncbi:MAG TPA: glycoside hydrolase family 38 C-terminal domain-containing protein, partial [Armatimonadota bacterium]|nr:glycoside hydrolase family 38 C-terminal domain-containing protein [Armatimonadota bacterium]